MKTKVSTLFERFSTSFLRTWVRLSTGFAMSFGDVDTKVVPLAILLIALSALSSSSQDRECVSFDV